MTSFEANPAKASRTSDAVDARFQELNKHLDYDVLVIGTGFSGIYSLHRMRQLGLRVKAFETGSSEGGTWYWYVDVVEQSLVSLIQSIGTDILVPVSTLRVGHMASGFRKKSLTNGAGVNTLLDSPKSYAMRNSSRTSSSYGKT